jgi:short-subunit dehydrogenase
LERGKEAVKDIENELKDKQHGKLEVIQCDLQSFKSIREFAETVKDYKINLLINNGAIMVPLQFHKKKRR